MKNLLISCILVSSVTAFADELNFGYFDSDQILSKATSVDTVRKTIDAKFSGEVSQLLSLSKKIEAEESQMMVMQKKTPDYSKLSANDKKLVDASYQQYNQDLNDFGSQYSEYKRQLSVVSKYAFIQVNKLIDLTAKNYAQQNKLKIIYSSDQFRYASDDYDITDKLLPLVNSTDVSKIVAKINDAKLPSLLQN